MSRRTPPQPQSREEQDETHLGPITLPGAPWIYKSLMLGAASAAFAVFAFSRYRIALPSQRIVRTGMFFRAPVAGSSVPTWREHVRVSQAAFVWPVIQRSFMMSTLPTTLMIHIEGRSAQMVGMKCPILITFRPKYDDEEWLCRYATLMDGLTEGNRERVITETITSLARPLVGARTMEEIFNNREEFNRTVVGPVAEKLATYGIVVDQFGFQELSDMEGSTYWKDSSRRAEVGMQQKAREQTAEKMKDGELGEQKHKTETRILSAEMNMKATTAENTRAQEIAKSNAELSVAKSSLWQQTQVAQTEAEAQADRRKIELATENARRQKEQLTEEQRATVVSKAISDSEAMLKEVEAQATATRMKAEADAYATTTGAQAKLVASLKEAEGITAIMQAQSAGTQLMVQACNGDPKAYADLLMIKENMPVKVTEAAAQGIRGMKPNISLISMDKNLSPWAQVAGSVSSWLHHLHRQSGVPVTIEATRTTVAEKA